MTRDRAETIALLALGWLVGNDEILPVFLGSTGLGKDDLAHRAADPDLLVSVLEFVLLDDAWVLSFARTKGIAPEEPFAALSVLAGASRMHWT